mgnify:CR=1 FL=1
MSKTNKSDKFLKLIGKHQEKKKVEKFRGTLGDYLKLLEKKTFGIINVTDDSFSGDGILHSKKLLKEK